MSLMGYSVIVMATGAWGAGRFFRYCRSRSSADWGSPFKNTVSGMLCLFVFRYHRLKYQPIGLPETGGAIVVSNHVSGLDPLLLIAASPRPLHFIIAREQFDRFWLKWLFKLAGCIPVEREARPEAAFRDALRTLRRGGVVALFPHGKIHLDTDPPRRIKGGAIKLSQLTGCPIFAVRIEDVKAQGRNLMALPIPSRAVLINKPPIYCQAQNHSHDLEKLTKLIESKDV